MLYQMRTFPFRDNHFLTQKGHRSIRYSFQLAFALRANFLYIFRSQYIL